MPDTPPDRLSNDPNSPYYQAEALKRDIGVRFKGVEKKNVAEYCVSEGWIKVEAAKTKDRYGNPLLIKLTGQVEPYFKEAKSATEQKPAKDEKPKKPEKAAKKKKK